MATLPFHPKLPDWRDRLNDLIRDRQGMAPDWGTNDCLSWACDAIEAQTGVDYFAAYRGKYTTAKGALRSLKRFDGIVMPIEFMDKHWGRRHHISEAQFGDIVVVSGQSFPYDMGPSAGVCYGVRSLFVGTGEHGDGLVRLDTLTLEHCYRPWASSSKPPSP